MEINVWTDEEAKKYFDGIKNNSHKEWYDVDWKRELSWEDTTLKKNTTQRAISGLANTFGGKVIIGFDKKGHPLGWKSISDIENHIYRKLEDKLSFTPLFKVKEYDYGNIKILVIFLNQSKNPIQCDDGVYYYREQSEFKFMPHYLLQKKFERVFIDEMFIDLVKRDLVSLLMHLKTIHNSSGLGYRVTPFSRHFIESAEKLYFYYKEMNILPHYFELLNAIRQWIADEGRVMRTPGQYAQFEERIDSFLNALEN